MIFCVVYNRLFFLNSTRGELANNIKWAISLCEWILKDSYRAWLFSVIRGQHAAWELVTLFYFFFNEYLWISFNIIIVSAHHYILSQSSSYLYPKNITQVFLSNHIVLSVSTTSPNNFMIFACLKKNTCYTVFPRRQDKIK